MQPHPAAHSATNPPATEPPVPTQGDGTPDYSEVRIETDPHLPVVPTKPGGSATEPESGGGYSG